MRRLSSWARALSKMKSPPRSSRRQLSLMSLNSKKEVESKVNRNKKDIQVVFDFWNEKHLSNSKLTFEKFETLITSKISMKTLKKQWNPRSGAVQKLLKQVGVDVWSSNCLRS